MFFFGIPILEDFSYVFGSLMFLIDRAWTFLNLPMFPTDPEALGALEYLIGPEYDSVFTNAIAGFVNLFKFDDVPIGDYSVLSFLISEIVLVILLFWIVKCVKNLFSK